MILDEEKEYLQQALDDLSPTNSGRKIPWLSMLTSFPLISCYSCFFAYGMGQSFLQVYQPTFYKEVLMLSIYENGFYCAITNMAVFGFKLVWGTAIMKLNQNSCSTMFTTKFSQAFSTITITTCYILLGQCWNFSKPLISLLLFCGIAAGNGAALNGFYTSMISLAPPYTNIISQGGRMFSIVAQLITPLIVLLFRSEGEWKSIFYVMAAITFTSGLLFLFFGKCDVQEWAKREKITNPIQPRMSSNFEKDWNVLPEKS